MSHPIVVALPEVEFCRDRAGKKGNNIGESEKGSSIAAIRAIPVIIDFQRLFDNPKLEGTDVIPGIKNRDLCHAAAALYDQSLPEVTEDIIYSTIFNKWSRTILLVQNLEDALEDFKVRAFTAKGNDKEGTSISTREKTYLGDGDVAVQTLKEPETLVNGTTESVVNNDIKESINKKGSANSQEEESRFADIFSDMEASEDEEEEDDSEKYMKGVEDFVKDVKSRREEKNRWLEMIKANNCSQEPVSLLGIEHRLLGCATFEQTYDKAGRRIIHLTLISTRKRYRKVGIGRYMVKIVRDPTIARRYNAVVVNADLSATDFFEKEGFSSDVLLNSRYAEVGDTWYNCKRMCYLPPYQSAFDSLSITDTTIPVYFSELEDLDLEKMEVDIAFFEEKSLQAFQSHALIIERLRKEVILLRARLSAQHDAIQALTKENASIRDAKYACEKELLSLKLQNMTNVAGKMLDLNLHLSDEEDSSRLPSDT